MSCQRLVVLETHPVQYHAPVYRELGSLGVPVTAIYGSDFSVAGYTDPDFQAHFAWDTDLLSGYQSIFLSRVGQGGGTHPEDLSGQGLRAALGKAQPSAVMVLGYGTRFHRTAIWAALRSGRPLLFRGETTDHARQRNRSHEAVRDQLLGALYRRCSRLLYIGARSREHFVRLGCPPERMVFSPYCVDTTPFQCTESARTALRRQIRAQWGAQDDETVLLFSGKLVDRKGCLLLLDAARELVKELPGKVCLVFLGDGPLRQELQGRAHGDPRVAVVFAGFRNQSALSAYFHGADLLVLPSRTGETWGLVVNEALCHGLPCVVTDAVGCAPDLIEAGVTGQVAQTASMENLGQALHRALPLAGRPEIRQQCRARVADYSVGRAAAGIAEAFFSASRHRQAPCSEAEASP
ncbi:MAG: glycosyltransferase family 4 protein [Actinomycetota bacterium]